MNKIPITNQEEFDKLPDNFKDYTEIYIIGELKEVKRELGNCRLYVSDSAKIDYVYGSAKIDCVNGSAKIGAVYGSAKIDNVSDSAKIDCVYGSAKIDNVYGTGSVNIYNESSVLLFGFAVAWLFNEKAKGIKKDKNSTIINVKYKSNEDFFFQNNPIDYSKPTVILYKRVSKDYKTQENTQNETLWLPGTSVEHKNWSPTGSECGEGKFHACARPIFCNQYRSREGDKYVAIKVSKKDLFAWKNPNHPRKIAFRKGKVIYECDEEGNKIDNK